MSEDDARLKEALSVLTRLKSLDATRDGKTTSIAFGGMEAHLDPAGVVFFPDVSVLVVSDLHLEKASSFARRRQFVPPYDTAATLARLSALVAKHMPRVIVSLGDSFHDREASSRLGDDSKNAIQALAAGRELIWVTGNHDPEPPQDCPGDCVDELAIGTMTLRHIADKNCTGFEISGHYHPAAKLAARGKTIRRNCFASDGTRMILPAFGVFTGGMSVLHPDVAKLFSQERFTAYMMGADAVFPIARRDIVR